MLDALSHATSRSIAASNTQLSVPVIPIAFLPLKNLPSLTLSSGGCPTQRGFRCAGTGAADVSGCGSGVPPARGWGARYVPSVETLGYFRVSLQDARVESLVAPSRQ